MDYCIIKFKKVKDNLKLSEYGSHNLRTRIHTDRKESIESERTPQNRLVINKIGAKGSDFGKKLTEYYGKKGIKIKKNSVMGIDLICTTSPEWWGDWKNDPNFETKLKKWQDTQNEYLKKTFGEDSILFCMLHLDETTPHLHFFISPEHTKTVKVKNRYKEYTKNEVILDANRWNPAFWTKVVDDYAEFNKDLGLKRGEVGSTAKETPLKEYKKELQKAITRANKLAEAYTRGIEDDEAKTAIILKATKEAKHWRARALEAEAKMARYKTIDNINKGIEPSAEELDQLGL